MKHQPQQKLSEALGLLAGLIAYPSDDFAAVLARGPRVLPKPVLPLFQDFAAKMGPLSPDEREELYTITFDLTPACVPYVGIHLFGEETFKRGEFMAALNGRFAAVDLSTQTELPDHLSNVLLYAARVPPEERQELVYYCLLGPLLRMIAELKVFNPYSSLLRCILTVLSLAYPGMQPPLSPLQEMQQHNSKPAQRVQGCTGCAEVNVAAETSFNHALAVQERVL